MMKPGRLVAATLLVICALAAPLPAYIGPGAGFAFLSSFLVFFLTFLLAVFSLIAWPFRFLWRAVRGQRAYRKGPIEQVVVLGLDGMEPTLAEKFMAEGKLPNLARLRKEGSYARLRTTTPAISPVAWSSFTTGTEPSKHNIFDFLSRDPRTYLPDLSSARIGRPKRTLALGRYLIPLSKPEIRGMRKSVPFWKILGDKGIASTILRVPVTFPPDKFKGHMLSGMCAPDLKGSQGTFAFFTEDAEMVRRHEGGVAVLVQRQGDVIRTELSGPEDSLLRRPVEIRLPLTITIDAKAGGAWLALKGHPWFFLREKTFSPWTPVVFKAGLGAKIRGTCRFRIASLGPKFQMYATPLNIDPDKPALPISQPFIYAVYLAKLLGRYITLGEANDTWALNEGALDEAAFLELTYANHAEWEGMLQNALAKTPRGLVAIVFETTDSIQHMFFRYLDKAHPALRAAPARMSPAVIEDLYKKMDDLVGRVAAGLGPKGALFVMSDHGFKSFRRGVNLNAWLHQNGYLSLVEGRTASGEWFKDVDWDRTRAYGLGLGGLYLNLKGREARGTVAPGEEAKALKAEISRKLLALKDVANGPAAVTHVYDRDAVYAGPYKDNAPDLIIGYNEGYRASWDGVTGVVGGAVIEDNPKAWSGDHCIDPALVPGVLFSSLKLKRTDPSIMDVAPTVLELFGIAPPPHMDGRSLVDAGTPAGPAQVKGQGR
ncbi:MAG TPA: alkaline phosphatase family protein [Candidatus Aminicenantes bacterium]|nr:alkaline phosphatase family protein [Candidatus Aminicenantes bacterium]HRY65315.1 alkaline phosphatase family protein [Candidatus Aminicenantes bacterium]HRZ72217.1 alkaline phosphatase family protein [Candidatus Aminicenantes bacterium]